MSDRVTTPVRIRIDRRRRHRRRRPDRQDGHRHRRLVRHRRRDRAGAGRRGRRRSRWPCATPRPATASPPRSATAPATGASTSAPSTSATCPASRPSSGLDGTARHPGQQRRRDGDPGADDVAERARNAVRHKPSRPLRARRRAARRARRRRQGPDRVGELGGPSALTGRVRRHRLRVPRLRPVRRLRTVQDRQRAVRRRGHPTLGRRRHHRRTR